MATESMVGGRIYGAEQFQNEQRALSPKAWQQNLWLVAESMVQRHSKTSPVHVRCGGVLIGVQLDPVVVLR
jgi:hypothetical protein